MASLLSMLVASEPASPALPLPSSEDFNHRSQERSDLLQRLDAVLQGDLVSRYFWAACQVCDMDRLKSLVDAASIDKHVINLYGYNTAQMLSYCTLNTL